MLCQSTLPTVNMIRGVDKDDNKDGEYAGLMMMMTTITMMLMTIIAFRHF